MGHTLDLHPHQVFQWLAVAKKGLVRDSLLKRNVILVATIASYVEVKSKAYINNYQQLRGTLPEKFSSSPLK